MRPFEPQTYSLTFETNGHGELISESDISSPVEVGTEIKLTPRANKSFMFDCYETIPEDLEITDNKFIMPDSNVTIKAKFKPVYSGNLRVKDNIKLGNSIDYTYAPLQCYVDPNNPSKGYKTFSDMGVYFYQDKWCTQPVYKQGSTTEPVNTMAELWNATRSNGKH